MPKLTKRQLEQVKAGTHYVCASCGGFFQKGRGDDVAMQESTRIFGAVPPELLTLVCEPCFNEWVVSSPVHA